MIAVESASTADAPHPFLHFALACALTQNSCVITGSTLLTWSRHIRCLLGAIHREGKHISYTRPMHVEMPP